MYWYATDVRQHHRLMPPPCGGGGIIIVRLSVCKIKAIGTKLNSLYMQLMNLRHCGMHMILGPKDQK